MSLPYLIVQLGYLLLLLYLLYFIARKVHYISLEDNLPDYSPPLILLYPLLQESKDTIYTTLIAHQKIEYPARQWRMVAVINWFDHETIAHIEELMPHFPFLDLMVMPPCSDPAWHLVWKAWQANPHAYWWHQGKTRHCQDLPPKKTRQLIYAFYHLDCQMNGRKWVLSYTDADSIPSKEHFKLGVAGLQGAYDLVQSTSMAGNLLDSPFASLCASDHIIWDSYVYPHMSGGQPYYCLGKGLFVWAADVRTLGGWNPYIAIEDPEFGLRFWKNHKKLGIIAAPLIEEVPRSFAEWLHQRNRWMCGFFQTLSQPLTSMHFMTREKLMARMNLILPAASLLHLVGLPLTTYVLYKVLAGKEALAGTAYAFFFFNLVLVVCFMSVFYMTAWKRMRYVLRRPLDRVRYILTINLFVLLVYWMVWSLPVVIGFAMFLTGKGNVWRRAQKVDANRELVRDLYRTGSEQQK